MNDEGSPTCFPVVVDKVDAQTTAETVLAELREETYHSLIERLLDRVETREVVGSSGTRYQVEIRAFWDSRKGGNLRVILGIDDGRWRAFVSPLTDGFIMAPDGTFIDEP